MKSNKVIIRIILFVSMAIVLTNCATGLSNNPDESNFGKIERLHTKYFQIPIVKVGDLNSTVTVQGQVEHRSIFGSRANGHIDISMLTPAGEVVDKVSVRPRPWKAKNIRRRRVIREASFFAVLDTPFISGSIIRLGFHKSSVSEESRLFDCGNNIAIPS